MGGGHHFVGCEALPSPTLLYQEKVNEKADYRNREIHQGPCRR